MYSFEADQLYWLEELDKNYFVEVRAYRAFLNGRIKEWSKPETRKVISLRGLEKFKSENKEFNLFRSWCVYKDRDCEDELGPVPLILDIDSDFNTFDLEGTHLATARILDSSFFREELRQERVRVIFSGQKGFHVEVKPARSLNVSDLSRELIREIKIKYDIKMGMMNSIGGDQGQILLDKLHDYLRLTGSWNCWIDEVGKTVRRKVLQMTPTEFEKYGVLEIIKKSEDNVDALM